MIQLQKLKDENQSKHCIVLEKGINVLSDPLGQPVIFDTPGAADLHLQILRKDFHYNKAAVFTIQEALRIICNKQAELEIPWQKPMREITNATSLEERMTLYSKAQRAFGAHPLTLDTQLKQLLAV